MTRIVTLPLRLGLRIAGFVLRPVTDAIGITGHARPEPEPAVWEPEPEAIGVEWPPEEPESRADVPAEPVHVETEEVLVAEVADEGAEEEPGAEITVAEPWEGYRRMKAADIIDRLAAATAEERAVVQLYESTHRRRKTVLAAAGYSQRK